jgi:hypothetical protein
LTQGLRCSYAPACVVARQAGLPPTAAPTEGPPRTRSRPWQDSNLQSAVYKVCADRPAGSGECDSRRSRWVSSPASELRSGLVLAGGMTPRMTAEQADGVRRTAACATGLPKGLPASRGGSTTMIRFGGVSDSDVRKARFLEAGREIIARMPLTYRSADKLLNLFLVQRFPD